MGITKFQKKREQRLSELRGMKNCAKWSLGWLAFGVMSLLLVLSLSGCANKSQNCKETQRLPTLSSVLDLQTWQSDRKSLSTELESVLSSAPKSSAK